VGSQAQVVEGNAIAVTGILSMEQESLSVFMRLRPIATLLQFWLILSPALMKYWHRRRIDDLRRRRHLWRIKEGNRR
jgi:hypothetical protein